VQTYTHRAIARAVYSEIAFTPDIHRKHAK